MHVTRSSGRAATLSVRRGTGLRVLLVALAVTGCGPATEAASPPAAHVATSTQSPEYAPPVVDPAAESGAPPEPSPETIAFSDPLPVNLEMREDCGLCGEASWLHEVPVFRMYADGQVVFRVRDAPTHVYRIAHLDEAQMRELVAYSLGEGGLEDAAERYEGDGDDFPGVTFDLHATWIDDDAERTVLVWPFEGETPDRAIRSRLATLADTLGDFDHWLAERGVDSRRYEPPAYTAALITVSGATPAAWPWTDLTPDEFAPGNGWGTSIARISPSQARAVVGDDSDGMLGSVPVGDGQSATLLVRPTLPGGELPGAYGIRNDTVAVTVTDDLRVRSLPEVSDRSLKLEPLLRLGDALYVVDGPVEGSGYRWYQVYAPRTDLGGWVALESKEGDRWIASRPIECTLGISSDPILDTLPYDLMHLACFRGVVMGGTYRLAEVTSDGLRCPDDGLYWLEPDWLNRPAGCDFEFGPDEADTGGYDLPQGGIFHPDIAEDVKALLDGAARPADGLLVGVEGQLDHPDAREGCGASGSDPPSAVKVLLQCRGSFVIIRIEAVR